MSFRDQPLDNALRITPPVEGKHTPTSVSSTAVLVASGVATYGEGWYTFASDVAFNFTFCEDGWDGTNISTPENAGVLAAGGGVSFWLSKKNTFFKVRAPVSGTLKHWKSSQGTE